jgi:hypothetical protein
MDGKAYSKTGSHRKDAKILNEKIGMIGIDGTNW